MMKRTLRFALTPFMLIARLMLGLAAFISSIASAVIGLAERTVCRSLCYRVCDRILAERYRLYGACFAGQSDWTSGGCKLSPEQNGSHPWIL